MTKKDIKQIIGIVVVFEIISSLFGLISLSIGETFIRGFIIGNIVFGVVLLILSTIALLEWLFE